MASPYSATDDDGDNITYSLPGLGADNFYITQSENGFNIYFSGMNIDREVSSDYEYSMIGLEIWGEKESRERPMKGDKARID